MKISEIIGKKCESTTGKRGYVFSVTESGGKLDRLVCADENEREFAIAYKDIIHIKESVLYAESAVQKKGTPVRLGNPVRLGKPVFDSEGIYLGRLTDFTVDRGEIISAHAGRKKFAAKDVICGDAVIVKASANVLKSDVKKNGRVIIKRGTTVTEEILKKAQENGEYVQTRLKTI